MKKLLILAGVIALTATTQVFAKTEAPAAPDKKPCPTECCKKGPDFARPDKARKPHGDMKKFEDELNLSAKQKEQAKQLREKQMEAAKPLFEKLKANEQESREIKDQLHQLREEGKKEFEAILTDKQLKKLEQLRLERKKEFAKKDRQGDLHRRPPMPPPCKCNDNPKPPVEE